MAQVLVHGATGFTGRLVCSALKRKDIPFCAGGRSEERLARLSREFGCATAKVDVRDEASLARALEGKRVVLACAGPFSQVGEPMVAAAVRAGVHYADTTGEQDFVARMLERYDAGAKAKHVCLVPAMAYEIAPADWAAHVAKERAGETPDSIAVVYMLRAHSGFGTSTTRGTKRSMVSLVIRGEASQYVDGVYRREQPAEVVRSFSTPSGRRVTAVSFPSPEAVVVPQHTGAKTVRTFMTVGKSAANVLRATRRIAPVAMRALGPLVERVIERSPEGPGEAERAAEFDILAEAQRGPATARVFVSGRDPYGLTAEIQALYAERALAGKLTASGLVAPSVAIPPEDAFAALREAGLTLSEPM